MWSKITEIQIHRVLIKFLWQVSTPQELWGSELADKIPTADFTQVSLKLSKTKKQRTDDRWWQERQDTSFLWMQIQVMEDDAALLDWLETLDRLALASPLKQVILVRRLGFVLVRGVPVERGPVPKLQVNKIKWVLGNIHAHKLPHRRGWLLRDWPTMVLDILLRWLDIE